MLSRYLRALLVLLSFALGAPALAQTTVTLRDGINGYVGTEDVDPLLSFPDTTRGTVSVLNTNHTTSMILIRFKIFASEGGPVPDGSPISSATLSLLKYEGPTSIFEARRVKKAWKEMEATWNVAASGLSWQTAGAQGATDVEAAADSQATAPTTGWFNLDVTAGVQAFAAGIPNNGWRVGYLSGTTGAKSFYSRNRTPEADRRPALTITYGDITCVKPTAQLSATPASGPAPLNVTFDASGSSAPAGDPITSLTLQYGDATANTDWADKSQTQQHTYTANGSYTASLTATNNCGTSTAATQPIQVGNVVLPTTPAAGTLGTALPTFHSMSLYYNPQTAPTSETVWMRYRRDNEATWRQGWHLWFDPRTSGNALPYAYRARGSAVYLEPNTRYFFELGTGTSYATATWHHHLEGTTWPETFAQDGATTVIPAGTTAYNITVGGSAATGYKVYDAQNNLRALPGTNGQNWCVRVTVPYVIVRNLRCTGAYQYGIAIASGVTNVVVEDNDISDWSHAVGGSNAWGTYGINEAGGVQLQGNNSRIVIQRNKIHDPRHGSFPWDFGHPLGPTAIMALHGGMQNVIRYNEVYATNGDTVKTKWLLDGIMGTDNFSTAGFPGSDSDIYHNIIKHVFDDAIEAEGGSRNVRVWGNYMDQVAVGMGTTTAHFGPIYVFRNVFNRMRFYHSASHPEPDDDNWDRGPAFKSYGVNAGYGGGRHYYFHNTTLQQPGSTYTPAQTWDLGAGFGLYGASGGNQGIRQVWTRNNVLHQFRSQNQSIQVGTGGGANNFDFDLHSGALINESGAQFTEPSGIRGVPTYKAGHGWNAGPRLTSEGGTVGEGNFQLDSTSLGLNDGTPLPNFAADIDNVGLARKSGVEVSGSPDRGAHDSASTQSMKFGLPAAQ